MNPIFPSLAEEIMIDRVKHLTVYYTATRLRLPVGIVQGVIRDELMKDFSSLFRGGNVE